MIILKFMLYNYITMHGAKT